MSVVKKEKVKIEKKRWFGRDYVLFTVVIASSSSVSFFFVV